MRYQKPTQLTSWSFSRYSVYKQCPALAKYKFIDKIREPSSPALENGARVHDLAEGYIKGTIARLPIELKAFENDFKEHRKQYKKAINGMVVEDQWAFTKDWTETAWNDWVACWVRIKIDCAHHIDDTTMRIRDWKTGKFREELNEEYMEQMSLYALAALTLHPHIDQAICELVYLDQGTVFKTPAPYTRAELPGLKKMWEKRVKAMLSDKKFPPKPNNKCRWCHFSKAKGGPCKF